MSNFRPIDRQTAYLLPPSVDDWLPKDHLARFVVDVVDQLDVSAMSKAYRGSGSASYHPCLLVGLLVYGYARVLKPQAGAGDMRLGRFPLRCGQPESRSRHDRRLPQTLFEGD